MVSTLITDLDNTLFDWVKPWHASYSAMMAIVAEQSGVPLDQLYAESKAVFQRHQTSEYAFLLQELPALQRRHRGGDVPGLYDEAIAAYDAARRINLRLYPGVLDTLLEFKRAGVLLVGYTESMRFYTLRRIRNLDLDGILDYLFTQDEHDLPEGIDLETLRKHPAEAYELKSTVLRTTPRGKTKPSSEILRFIMNEVGCDPQTTAYVGDNLAKDMLMAQDAGVLDVLAQYGQAHTSEEYELLKKVTHWTAEQVAREQELSMAKVNPSYVLEQSFSELMDLFALEPNRRAPIFNSSKLSSLN